MGHWVLVFRGKYNNTNKIQKAFDDSKAFWQYLKK
jgi:hypothetical protein